MFASLLCSIAIVFEKSEEKRPKYAELQYNREERISDGSGGHQDGRKEADMLAIERRKLILEQLHREKRVVVSELSRKFSVSERHSPGSG